MKTELKDVLHLYLGSDVEIKYHPQYANNGAIEKITSHTYGQMMEFIIKLYMAQILKIK